MTRRGPVTPQHVQRELDATRASLPIFDQVGALFTDPRMFASYDHFRAAGFALVNHAPHKVMTGRHKRTRDYLFKKYDDAKPDQLANYLHRIEGSRLIQAFVTAHGFSRVMTPRKWLYELPVAFPERYLLVVERVDLAERPDTERAYGRISAPQLRELATILYYFRGLSSTASNLPFTTDGKIAFIDTERWHHDKDFLRKVGARLSVERIKQARKIYKELRGAGERPFASTFK